MRLYGVGSISVTVLRGSELHESFALGAEKSTLFQAGSLSKVLTAFGVLELVRQGKLSLDQEITPLLKGWKLPESSLMNGAKLTARELLTHSAGVGVPGFGGYARDGSLPTLIQILKGQAPANSAPVELLSKPGTQWFYSGGGTTILQLLIESMTSASFSDWMKRAILDPLGMKESGFYARLPDDLRARAARGLQYPDTKIADGARAYPELAAAGLWSTADDLARSVAAVIRGQSVDSAPVGRALYQQMIHSQFGPSGLGPMVRSESGAQLFEHEGVNQGFVSRWMGWIQDGKSSGGVAIMTAAQGGEFLIPEILYGIARDQGWPVLNPETRIRPHVEKLPVGWERSWIGRYQKVGEQNFFEIVKKDSRLWMKFNSSVPNLPLERTESKSGNALAGESGIELRRLDQSDEVSFIQVGGPHPVSTWKKL